MKVIKKMIQATLFVAILFMTQQIQAQHRPHHKDGQMLEKMKTELQLTEKQETKIKAIQEKYQPQMETLKEQTFEDKTEKRAAFKTLMKAQKEEISQVLTAEQQTIVKEKKGERREKHQARKGEKKELHQALKAYKEAHIHPVILKQRAKLEQDISAKDKTTIAELRVVFNKLKEEKKTHKKEFSKDKNFDRQEMMAQRKAKKEAIKDQYKEELETLKALNEKYSAQIDALHQEIKPQEEEWKTEMKAIREQYVPKHKNPSTQKGGKRGHKKGHQKGHRHHKTERYEMGKKHFLLLNPNETTIPTSNNSQAFTSLKSYPNPASHSSTLTYDVTTATRIKIALTDESGHTIKVLVNEYKKEGTYQLKVDLSDLKNGAYYYTVTDNGGISSAKIVVNK